MNSSGGMYSLKSYYDSDEKVELPSCMYSLKNYYTDDIPGNEDNAGMSPELVELERRQDAILNRLEQLKQEVASLSNQMPAVSSAMTTSTTAGQLPADCQSSVLHDVVINANPQAPPLSLFVLYQQLQQQYRVLPRVHVHSSVCDLADPVTTAFEQNGSNKLERGDCQLGITLIWKDVKTSPELIVNTSVQSPILGEGAMARYLARLINPAYDSSDAVTVTEIDSWIDTMCIQFTSGNKKEKAAVFKSMNSKLGNSDWLVGSAMSLADVVAWSKIIQSQQTESAPANVKKWLTRCSQDSCFRIAINVSKAFKL